MSKWISVKDRLPDNGELVIIYIDLPESQGGHEVTSGRCWLDDRTGECCWAPSEWRECKNDIVSHWMPLPRSPKGSKTFTDEIEYSKSTIDSQIHNTREVVKHRNPDEFRRGWNNALDRLSHSLFTIEEMQKPDVRTFGNLTVRELWTICNKYVDCEGCPFYETQCWGRFWAFPEDDLDVEVEL